MSVANEASNLGLQVIVVVDYPKQTRVSALTVAPSLTSQSHNNTHGSTRYRYYLIVSSGLLPTVIPLPNRAREQQGGLLCT